MRFLKTLNQNAPLLWWGHRHRNVPLSYFSKTYKALNNVWFPEAEALRNLWICIVCEWGETVMRLINSGHENHGTGSDSTLMKCPYKPIFFGRDRNKRRDKKVCPSTRPVKAQSPHLQACLLHWRWVGWSGLKGQCPPRKAKMTSPMSHWDKPWVFNLHFATTSEFSSKMNYQFCF